MKRRLGFHLTPLKIGSRPDVVDGIAPGRMKAEPTPPIPHPLALALAHVDNDSRDDLAGDSTPFINRRVLSQRTELELRAACAQVLHNFKPSDHGMADVDPKLDFGAMNRRRENRAVPPGAVGVHRPTGAPPEYWGVVATDATTRRQQQVAAKQLAAAKGRLERANTGRRREHADGADAEDGADRDRDSQPTVPKPAPEPRRDVRLRSEAARAAARPEVESDVGTPLTGSTDAHLHDLLASTAPTSAARTSGNSLERLCAKVERPPTQLASERKDSPRRPSRSRSIRDIKAYIFPRSTQLSRQSSQDSLRNANNRYSAEKEPKTNGSSNGWRSWGLQRLSTSKNSSRPGSSRGRAVEDDQEKNDEVNLNRDLPPLPSLDSWKPPEQPTQTESRKSPAPSKHIAAVMRPDQRQGDYATAIRSHHRKSASDTLAFRYVKSANLQLAQPSARPPGLHKKSEKSMDFDQIMSAMDRPDHNSRSASIDTTGHRHEPPTPNFSRKISTDIASSLRSQSTPYQNNVEISSGKRNKEDNKWRLKKVISGWMLRKEKKENSWMDTLERNGIRGGVMVQDEAALPPVVRY